MNSDKIPKPRRTQQSDYVSRMPIEERKALWITNSIVEKEARNITAEEADRLIQLTAPKRS